jgi:hypothetical protein
MVSHMTISTNKPSKNAKKGSKALWFFRTTVAHARRRVKSELPKTLEAVRKRVIAVVLDKEKIETQTIAAGSIGSEKDDKPKCELAGTAILYK